MIINYYFKGFLHQNMGAFCHHRVHGNSIYSPLLLGSESHFFKGLMVYSAGLGRSLCPHKLKIVQHHLYD